MPKYVTKVETNLFGEQQLVTRHKATTGELLAGGAVIGLSALMWAASQETKSQYAQIDYMLTRAAASLDDGDWLGVYNEIDGLFADTKLGKYYVSVVFGSYYKGRAARFEGDYKNGILFTTSAIDYAAEARNRGTNDSERLAKIAQGAMLDRGCCYLELGDNATAVKEFTTLLHTDPTNTPALTARGVAFRSLNNLDASLRDLNKALEIHPDIADQYIERAKTYSATGNLKLAMADYDQAVIFDSQRSRPYLERASYLASTGNHSAAITDFDHALALAPNSPRALRLRAASRRSLGQHNQADDDESHAKQIEQFEETYADYLSHAQRLYYSEGQQRTYKAEQATGPNWRNLGFGILAATAVALIAYGYPQVSTRDLLDNVNYSLSLPSIIVLPLSLLVQVSPFLVMILTFALIIAAGSLLFGAIAQPFRAKKYLNLIEKETGSLSNFGGFYEAFIAAKKTTSLTGLKEEMRTQWGNGAELPKPASA